MRKSKEEIVYNQLKDVFTTVNENVPWGTCSLCNYGLSFFWMNDKLYFDAGCHCLDKKLIERKDDKFLIELIRKHPKYFKNLLVKYEKH